MPLAQAGSLLSLASAGTPSATHIFAFIDMVYKRCQVQLRAPLWSQSSLLWVVGNRLHSNQFGEFDSRRHPHLCFQIYVERLRSKGVPLTLR